MHCIRLSVYLTKQYTNHNPLTQTLTRFSYFFQSEKFHQRGLRLSVERRLQNQKIEAHCIRVSY